MPSQSNIHKIVAAVLLALTAAAVLTPSTARAQKAVEIPTAKPEQLEAMGVRRGDYIIPFSSIPDPSDPTLCHTNFLIYSPQIKSAETLRYALSVLSYMALPVNAPLGSALAQTQTLLAVRTKGDSGVVLDPPDLTPFAVGNGHNGTLSPTDVRKAYGVTGNGSGVIVLLGAYNYPSALSDFNTFSTFYGLPTQSTTNGATANSNTVFQVVYANGRQPAATTAATQANWNGEAALDVQWAHAMAPNAKIVLVLGATNGGFDLTYGAALKGGNVTGVKEVSMSFGGGEFSSETFFDATFNKSGVVFFASTGDTGGQIEYPSSSPYVVGVGGTRLTINTTTGAVVSETAWGTSTAGSNGTGGGISTIQPLPAFQNGVKYPTVSGGAGTTALTKRGAPDISAVGDPATGVSIILNGAWNDYIGGTSLSSPLAAGMANASGSFRASSTAELTYIYNLYTSGAYSAAFRDITATVAGGNFAGIGYDLTTGVGSPIGPSAF